MKQINVLLCLGLLACSSGETAVSGGTGASAPAPSKPVVTCVDLPGKLRTSLEVSPDGKTFYFREFATEIEQKTFLATKKRPRYDLYRVAATGGAPEKLAEDVGDSIAVGPNNEVVFEKVKKWSEYINQAEESALYVRLPDGKELELSPKEEKARVNTFLIDPKGQQVYFTFGDYSLNLYSASLQSGEPKKIAENTPVVWGMTPDGSSLIVRSFVRMTAKLPISGGKDEPIGEDGFSMRLVGDRLVFAARDEGGIKSMPLAGGAALPISWTQKDDLLLEGEGQLYLSRFTGEGSVLFSGDAQAPREVTRTELGRLIAAKPLGRSTVVLIRYNTTGPEEPETQNETDICVIPEDGTLMPSGRRVPKKELGLLEKLTALAKEDLSGAKIEIWRSPYAVAVFSVEGAGPEDAESLRQRAKTLQAQISSIEPKLGARIEFEKNKRVALAYFHPGAPETLLLAGGERGKLLYLEEQYDISLDPGTLFEYQRDSKSGSFSCRGTVKNNGKTPLTVKVRCELTSILGLTVSDGETKPKTIPPGKTGKYDFYVGAGAKESPIKIKVVQDDKEVPYFNAFSHKSATGQ